MTFIQMIKNKFWYIYRPIFGKTISPQKLFHEFNYWNECKEKERTLSNDHYKYFYTKHFNINDDFYIAKKILDVGCGPRGSLEWAYMCTERIGLDPLAESYKVLGTDKHNMNYIMGNVEDMPFEDGYFDIVSSFNSLDHIDDLDNAISEIKRVTTYGGHLLLLTDVNHNVTDCEPIKFSWDIVSKFIPEFKIVEEIHFEKLNSSIYESILQNIAYDHSNIINRYGILSLHARKNKDVQR